MIGLRSLAALAVLLAGATPAPTPAPKPPALVELETSARRLLDVKVDDKGEAKVEAVRRRLGALAALNGAARTLLRGADVPVRLGAHFALAEAHEAFAKDLFSAKAPRAAREPAASRAWTDQVAKTVERTLATARAHARSCVELAKAAKAEVSGCAQVHQRLSGGKALPVGDPAAVAKARMEELQGCFDDDAAERANPEPLEIVARLSLDAMGRVEEVTLSPRREDRRGLYDCVADGLWIWTFPGVSDVEIELPIRLARR